MVLLTVRVHGAQCRVSDRQTQGVLYVDAICFLLIAVAAVAAVRSKRLQATLIFSAIAFIATTALFLHHVTDPLGLNL